MKLGIQTNSREKGQGPPFPLCNAKNSGEHQHKRGGLEK